ncbi:MAG: protein translocase SEC61 complex subunit gamma [Desulfurococcaceae archaeon]
MNLRELIEMWRKILMIASKPTKEEYLVLLRIALLGLAIVGGLAFIIRLIFYTLIFPYQG